MKLALFKLKYLVSIFGFLIFIYLLTPLTKAAPPPNFQTSLIVGSGLNGPSGFEIAPDGRIFILERAGKIKIFKNGALLATPFADLPSTASGDRGLIGIAFDPAFNTNHYVYFYHTGLDLLNYLVRFDASGDVGTNKVILYQTTSPSNLLHVGGSIRFGPDGKLYFAVGDNGDSTNAQNLSNPHGKILRINKDGTVPSDNPFFGQSGKLAEIWAYGFRNPWRFQFDSANGRIFGGDVGQATWEEVNRIEKGLNYGWPTCEGMCSVSGMTNPLYAYNHNSQSAAVTGGPVYRATQFPATYQGRYFFGDYAMGFIKTMTLDSNGNSTGIQDFDLTAGSVVDLKVAPDGSLYYLTYYPGALYKISYSTSNPAPTANATADKTKGLEPLTVNFSSAGSFDPNNDPLTYFWNFGDNTTSTQANPSHTYNNKGTYTVTLTVSDGTNSSQASPIVIQVGNPPVLTIGSPTDNSSYIAGDLISYSAQAVDSAGVDINENGYTTEVIFHHQTHTHPFLGPITSQSGQFTIPQSNFESSDETWFEIKVTATDSNNLSATKSVNIYPIKSSVTLATNPAGLQVLLDNQPVTTPYTFTGVVNYTRSLSANSPQILNGKTYQFVSWSDGGTQTHSINTPQNNTTYTATFQEVQGLGFTGEYWNITNPGPSTTIPTTTPNLIRIDPAIDFNWALGSPGAGIGVDAFAIRWTKTENFATSGTYRFTATSDDGIRVYIDNQLIIDQWSNHPAITATVDKSLTAGNHNIRVEYYDHTYDAVAKLTYSLIDNPPPPPPPTGSFLGEYWNVSNPGPSLTIPTTPALVTRNDSAIDFNWGFGSPDPLINVNGFAARWTKTESFATDGTYRFTATSDDGIRVYIDNQLIIDQWSNHPSQTSTADRALTAGNHLIRVEYYDHTYDAIAKLSYAIVSNPPPPPPPPPSGAWNGEYFTNNYLSGTPSLVRQDNLINFNWGNGGPGAPIPNDFFSVRWTKTESFPAGNKTFTIQADDGVRFYIDNILQINDWTVHAPKTYTKTVNLTSGNHNLKLEYFEEQYGAIITLQY